MKYFPMPRKWKCYYKGKDPSGQSEDSEKCLHFRENGMCHLWVITKKCDDAIAVSKCEKYEELYSPNFKSVKELVERDKNE